MIGTESSAKKNFNKITTLLDIALGYSPTNYLADESLSVFLLRQVMILIDFNNRIESCSTSSFFRALFRK